MTLTPQNLRKKINSDIEDGIWRFVRGSVYKPISNPAGEEVGDAVREFVWKSVHKSICAFVNIKLRECEFRKTN